MLDNVISLTMYLTTIKDGSIFKLKNYTNNKIKQWLAIVRVYIYIYSVQYTSVDS